MRMTRRTKRTVLAVLLPILLFAFCLPSPCVAQDAAPTQTTGTGSGDDDETAEIILISLAAVVVGVLLILGIRSDFFGHAENRQDDARDTRRAGLWGPESEVRMGERPQQDDAEAPILQITSRGIEARF